MITAAWQHAFEIESFATSFALHGVNSMRHSEEYIHDLVQDCCISTVNAL